MSQALELPFWTVLPFAGLLLSIAILPLLTPHFWDSNRNKGLVAALFALPVALYLLLAHGEAGLHELLEKGKEYASFILLLGALFAITGGIRVRGSLSGAPLLNTALLGFGAVLANLIGTTGASVLLVRPLLRANAPRENKTHVVVFFIFVVSNCGGLLTPLGDPPLFLGFLKGVPFGWTLQLWKEWALVNGLLLVIFNVWDQIVFNREEAQRPGSQLEEVMQHEPLQIEGRRNFLFLGAVVATILAAGHGLGSASGSWPFGVQEALLLGIAVAAYRATPARLSRGQRLRLRTDHRGGRALRRNLRHDGPGPAAAQRQRGALRARAAVAVLSGRRGCSRASSTTRPPTSRSRPPPAASKASRSRAAT